MSLVWTSAVRRRACSFPLDEDRLSICQKIASPFGFEFCSCLRKAFAILSQFIDPPKSGQRRYPQLSSYSPIRRFFREIKLCCSIMHGFSKLQTFVKRFLTSQTLVSLNPQPLAIANSSGVCSMLFNWRPSTIPTLFFSDINLSSLSHFYITKRRNN